MGAGGSFPSPIDEVTTSCTPPGVERITPFVLGAVLLLLPDAAEIAVPGLISLKRKVQEQDQRLERAEYQQAQLLHSVSMMAAQVNTSVNVGVVPEVLYGLAAKAGSTALDGSVDSASKGELDDREPLIDELRARAQELSDAKHRANRVAVSAEADSDADKKLVLWAKQYRREIDGLTQELNRITSAPDVYDSEYLRAVLVAARQILSLVSTDD
ncbi:hypothetical protein L1857_09235 [Amycolatopsis thermalba]|uniref:Uncharacterized protein n=1 Tax=Amycolatopsis thermalba TaxID=944492 RepID=A0ABY4NSF7_9PSEU|nr:MULTISPECIES: hypothetical protein [Amycolatopsis]UQS22987.1 hypothetical protein L1857_09235 [Amycolatopsis thermalba]